MSDVGAEALEGRAERDEESGDYRSAFGLWKQLLSRYKYINGYITLERREYWERHMEYCDQMMKR